VFEYFIIIIIIITFIIDNVLVQWTTAHGQSGVFLPVGSLSSKQHEWDKPSIAADLDSLNARFEFKST